MVRLQLLHQQIVTAIINLKPSEFFSDFHFEGCWSFLLSCHRWSRPVRRRVWRRHCSAAAAAPSRIGGSVGGDTGSSVVRRLGPGVTSSHRSHQGSIAGGRHSVTSGHWSRQQWLHVVTTSHRRHRSSSIGGDCSATSASDGRRGVVTSSTVHTGVPLLRAPQQVPILVVLLARHGPGDGQVRCLCPLTCAPHVGQL